MHPVLFEIGDRFALFGHEFGPLRLHSFGLLLAIAFLLCAHLHAAELGRRGLPPDIASSVLTWAIVGSLVGARAYYMVEFWDEVRHDVWGAMFSGAGLVAYGGFVGGIAASWLALRWRRAPILVTSDAAAPLLALGYAIGRIGCLLAGDGDYGPPSDLPWAMAFPNGVRPTTVAVHPTPLYETLWMLVAFAGLWALRRRPWPAGALFALYLVVAGVERFVIEFWRVNPKWAFGLSGAQWIAAATVMIGTAWLAWLHASGRWRKAREVAAA